jgi:catechol 2,3-dioxygenase-like lactoylglutathione lyase family enzyme
MISISVSVDVPSLEEGLRFYGEAFGFVKASEPYPGVAVVRVDNAELLLLAKQSDSAPFPEAGEKRRYHRHWTPVHLDLHVDDFKESLAKALSAGAKQEHLFEHPGRPSVAFCSDPFGHGFCLIERRKR